MLSDKKLAKIIEAYGLPAPTMEYRFNPPRRWRFDFCWQVNGVKVALEYEGGIWVGGRHIFPLGYQNDCEKYNMATLLGWKVIRVTSNTESIRKGLEIVKKLLEDKNDDI